MAASQPLWPEHVVCEDPYVWVFDDLLSENFLGLVDGLFQSSRSPTFSLAGRTSQSVTLDLETDPKVQELFDVIRSIAGIREVDQCCKALISDVSGVTQDAHVDHVSLDDLARRYEPERLRFLDASKQSFSERHPGRVVPTLSVVCYFNDVGGIFFPDSTLPSKTIPGKRGRIVMFQNYIDSQRPMHNPRCLHYGTYYEDKPKRVMTMGVLANETPVMLGSPKNGQAIDGLIYCPGVPDEPLRHENPAYGFDPRPSLATRAPTPPPPEPKPDLIITLDATFEEGFWQISCSTMAGEVKCTLCGPPKEDVQWLIREVKKGADPDDSFTIRLVTRDGENVPGLLYSLDYIFGEQSMIKKAMAAAAEAQALATEAGQPEEMATAAGMSAADAAKDAHFESLIGDGWEFQIGSVRDRVPEASRRQAIEALCLVAGHAGRAMSILLDKRRGRKPDYQAEPVENEIKRMFERADGNSDGWLSREEWEMLLSSIGAILTDAQKDIIFEHIDVNKDGKLRYDELLAWCFELSHV
eukprot:TRINITY_DN83457_c0_g1_i1.p1 TRINITY_DN83457_c0_g1~~TRINITY_DN83457_c0_g1_i1.p1  ORF type:complete len:536 (-),score=96.26 TRINITY_DN83457_c0_g1_i1:41-1618(-)